MPNPTNETKKIRQRSATVAILTLLSRIFGLIRNQILSHYFGASHITDAFIAAFTIPNALRRVFSEGGLTPGLTVILREPNQKPSDVINASFLWISAIAAGVSAVGIIFTPQLFRICCSEFALYPGKLELAISLSRWLFVFVLFISWAGFFMGVLNTYGSFALSAFAPSLNSLSVIAIVPAIFWSISPDLTTGIFIYVSALIIGSALQVLVHLPSIIVRGLLPKWPRKIFDPAALKLFKLTAPSLFALGIYQLNIVINRSFLSGNTGGMSHLFYADLLIELPLSLIASSIGATSLTSFSDLTASERTSELESTLLSTWKSACFISIPCSAFILALSKPIVSSIYYSGNFNSDDLAQTAQALFAYGIGLPFFAASRVIASYYFSGRNMKIPFLAALGSLIVNLVGTWALEKPYGAFGCAISLSISFIAYLAILFSGKNQLRHPFHILKLVGSLPRTLFASVIIFLSLQLMLWILNQATKTDIWGQSGLTITKIFFLGFLSLIGLTIYLSLLKRVRLHR